MAVRYIALLRGINVGGKNLISMKDLKELFQENGYGDVTTYINSGNIIFSSENEDTDFLKNHCEALIREKLNIDLSLLILTADELIQIAANAPGWWGTDDNSKHNAIFVIPPATSNEICREVGEAKPQYEKVSAFGRVIFWSAPLETFSRTRWSRIVGTPAYGKVTIRNSNTVKKLADLVKPE